MTTTRGRQAPPAPAPAPAPPAAPALAFPVVIDRSRAKARHLLLLTRLEQIARRQDEQALAEAMPDLLEFLDAVVVDFGEYPATEVWAVVAEVNRQLRGGGGGQGN